MSEISTPEDPEEYISLLRRATLGKNGLALADEGSVQIEIPQNVREIRAILKTNAEIFSRCMPLAIEHQCDENNSTSSATFIRFAVTEVNTRHEKSDGNEKTIVYVHPTRCDKSFDTTTLSSIPNNIKGIFEILYKVEPQHYVDFEAFFEKGVSLLHGDILTPFLVHLKGHLMSVQVCLGHIEGWLLEHNDTHSFLESAFGSTINATVMKELELDVSVCLCPQGTHDQERTCLRCYCAFKSHIFSFTGEQLLGARTGQQST
jgi:hypothetical protein